MKSKLSYDEVAKLIEVASSEVRIETAGQLASRFARSDLSDQERQIAAEILRLMARDAELRVREALAAELKANPLLPHDLAVGLANDVESVALPVLQYSTVLTDADLVEIVQSQNVAKQVAVARRDQISAAVSDALVETGNAEVVSTLVANRAAELSEQALQTIVQDFAEEPSVHGLLIDRTKLPVTVMESLMALVSDELRSRLVRQHNISESVAAELSAQSRERAVIRLSAGADREDVCGLVQHMRANGRLTSSVLLRALCVGDLAFFEAGMAELGNVPMANGQRLIYDQGKRGFEALFAKAGLPKPLFPAFRSAIDVAQETEYDGGAHDRERYSRRLLERILTQYAELGISLPATDLEYLLRKLNQLSAAVGDDG